MSRKMEWQHKWFIEILKHKSSFRLWKKIWPGLKKMVTIHYNKLFSSEIFFFSLLPFSFSLPQFSEKSETCFSTWLTFYYCSDCFIQVKFMMKGIIHVSFKKKSTCQIARSFIYNRIKHDLIRNKKSVS